LIIAHWARLVAKRAAARNGPPIPSMIERSMFAGIADFVVRRHRLIIIAWIVALMVALPLAPLVSSVVQYEETENAPASLESTGANNYIVEHFGGASEQPTTLIVLTSSNVLSDEVKQVVSRIESDLKDASMDGRMHKVTVNSLNGVAEIYTLNVLMGLNSAYTGANLTAYVIYGLPQDYRSLWQEVNQSSPETFANITALSKSIFEAELEGMMANMTAEQKTLVQAYFNSTYAWWSSLGHEPGQDEFRAGIAQVAVAFGPNIADPTARSMFADLQQALGFEKYNDLPVRKEALAAFIASLPSVTPLIRDPWVVIAAGDLGTSYSTSKVLALSRQITANSSLGDFPVVIPKDLLGLLVSPDNSTMLVALTYEAVAANADPGKVDVEEVRGIVQAAVQGTGVRAYVTGSDPINVDSRDATYRDMAIIEPVTIVLVLVLIGLFFRSFVASSIPPLSIGVALGISYALIYLIGIYVMSIHYSVLTLLLTSMMGAGCDYCIFILSRYREERQNGHEKEESVRRAVAWAGESIATSGATVIIGFGVLSIGRYAMMQSLGVALAIGVTVALLVALTLLPSLLMLLGDRMFWPTRLHRPVKVRTRPGYFTRSARFAIKHAKVIVVVAVVISIPTTYLVYTMQTSYDFIGSMADSESKDGIIALQDGFGGGKVNPTQIALQMSTPVVNGDTFDSSVMHSIENISMEIVGLNNIKQVISPTRPNGVSIDYTNQTALAQYRTTMLHMVSQDGKAVLMTVIFQAEPFNQDSIASIQDLRNVAVEAQNDPHVVKMYVGGATASMCDIASMVQSDFGNMEYLAIIGIYIVLLVVLGSVISPLKSILTILLSISWTLAATLILFQVVLGQHVLYLVPMILLVVCLGLGMDYDILLITRIREEATSGKNDHDSIVHAVEKTGGIITACGIVMAAAFGSMMLSNGYLLKEFGFALMFAILLDATIVRIYLVPAVMSLLGKWNWWAPGPLMRVTAQRNEKRAEELKPADAPQLEEVKAP
jgi:putative drug exporter of the RND superfamily